MAPLTVIGLAVGPTILYVWVPAGETGPSVRPLVRVIVLAAPPGNLAALNWITTGKDWLLALLIAARSVFAVYAFTARDSVVAASLVPAILLAGGIGAFVKTYRVWKEEGAWPAWQGAGWFLLTFMLVCLSIPGAAMQAT